MRGSAAWFADQLNASIEQVPGLIFATGMINIASLRGLLAPPLDRVPILLYMHENQLTYPRSAQEKFNFQFGFTNIISAMAADRVVFNSTWQRDEFLAAIPAFLKQMPEAAPERVAERLQPRCEVLGVGLEREPLPADHTGFYLGGAAPEASSGPPVLLWNHRWDHDKCPEIFAAALKRLMKMDLNFAVAFLGESAGRESVFVPLRDALGRRCVSFGHQPSRAQYDRQLEAAAIVVSCAKQENFGISVAEAVQAGCYAVLPQSQVYPLLYGPHCSGRHFYEGLDGLVNLLRDLLTSDRLAHECALSAVVDPYCWTRLAPQYDKLIEKLVNTGRNPLPAP